MLLLGLRIVPRCSAGMTTAQGTGHSDCFSGSLTEFWSDVGLQFYRAQRFQRKLQLDHPNTKLFLLMYPSFYRISRPGRPTQAVHMHDDEPSWRTTKLAHRLAGHYGIDLIDLVPLNKHCRHRAFADTMHPGSDCYSHWIKKIDLTVCRSATAD